MGKPKVLIVTSKWNDFTPESGPSNAQHNYLGSLPATGLAEMETFFIDEYLLKARALYDEGLLAACGETRPDLIFVSLSRGVDFNVGTATLGRIRDEMGIRVVLVFPDTFGAGAARWCAGFAPVADLLVLQDSYSDVLAGVTDTSKILPCWTPQDPNVFHAGGGARSIDVSFLGSLARYPERKLSVGLLAAAGIGIVQRGGQNEDRLEITQYGELLRASKISLNFARPVFDEAGFQCKGRVFESTLSGAMLLEQKNPETRRWFTPGTDYVEFTHERDLLDAVRHYLAHEDERAEIARAGCEKAHRLYSAHAYWRLILTRAHCMA